MIILKKKKNIQTFKNKSNYLRIKILKQRLMKVRKIKNNYKK